MMHFVTASVAALAALATVPFMAPGPARAAEFPSGPIRFIVPFNAGGGTDVVARVVAEEMSKSLGQPVLVDNRPGAQGIAGTKAGAMASPDGQTITFVLQATLALNPSLYKATNYDPAKDFVPISQLSTSPYVVAVNPKLGVKTIQELIAKAKATPGSINYASGAAASHLASLLFQKTVGIAMTHIPYSGSGQALTDLLSGRVGVMLSSPVSVLPHIKSGSLIPLAVTGPERIPSLPDVPTVAELGYPDFDVSGWYGIAAPKGTDPAIVAKLNAAVVAALQQDSVRASLEKSGVDGRSSTPEEFRKLIDTEIKRWTALIKEEGIKPE
ncbi:Bug family tripartite tricarboxylate transporter substrate binding protein [Chelatococcus asaccharovorans]|uniref:Tripartite-type tricarboxylate transporter receptor subunit TctC n=1 Tax=Chelatococcus asaccharovorans TaxID=28210 RepID=A0A2V3UBR9_9HYPH|nr:tripartite tricarboxylate transporter substrate binding protein [Chelatococcus asaccharovorans]MBS7703619.1 tripartite tricarboxylate transporter substrate binding protein [Chelatococcus asaccharovorans]PXW61964.1 tripartite-type tricarboxylate transporter receptor subunit TctC [Chelatococcus asaccharovorans]